MGKQKAPNVKTKKGCISGIVNGSNGIELKKKKKVASVKAKSDMLRAATLTQAAQIVAMRKQVCDSE